MRTTIGKALGRSVMKALIRLVTVIALAVMGLPAQASAGSKLAVTRVVDPAAEDREIFVMNGDGSGARQLTRNETNDLGAVWSPNGKTVAFYSENAIFGAQVSLIDADDDDGLGRPLLGMRSRFPSWSESGKIAFDNGGPTFGEIFVVNPDGTDLQQLTCCNASQRNIRPAWSPDGAKIAFTSRRDGDDEIYVMNADGSNPVNVTNSPHSAENAPAWSPNGTRIIFQSNRDEIDRDGNIEIYSMNADGSDRKRLTFWKGRDLDADWAPNGRTIAWGRDVEPIAEQVLQVFVMNADGSGQRQLTPLEGDEFSENGHPGWGRGPVH